MRYSTGGLGGTTPVLKNLIIINVLMFIISLTYESIRHTELNQILGLYYFKSEYFKPIQIVSHMFMHGGFTHIFFNMFMLWMFGRVLENVWGPKRFFIFYIVTGIGAAFIHTAVTHFEVAAIINEAQIYKNNPSVNSFVVFVNEHFVYTYQSTLNISEIKSFVQNWETMPNNRDLVRESFNYIDIITGLNMDRPTVGASGAVYGILLAFGMLFPNTQLMLLFPPIPIKAKYLVILLGIASVVMGVTNTMDGVAHFAHLGGMIFGFILIKLWSRDRTNFY